MRKKKMLEKRKTFLKETHKNKRSNFDRKNREFFFFSFSFSSLLYTRKCHKNFVGACPARHRRRRCRRGIDDKAKRWE
jgi:hypothetical protein